MFRQGGARQLRYAEQGYVGVRFILAVEARHGGASSERACLGSRGTDVIGKAGRCEFRLGSQVKFSFVAIAHGGISQS